MALAQRIRSALLDRAVERRAYRRLAAELAGFRTPAERAELDELIARHSPDETRVIRQILERQDIDRHLLGGVGGHLLAGVGGHRAA